MDILHLARVFYEGTGAAVAKLPTAAGARSGAARMRLFLWLQGCAPARTAPGPGRGETCLLLAGPKPSRRVLCPTPHHAHAHGLVIILPV